MAVGGVALLAFLQVGLTIYYLYQISYATQLVDAGAALSGELSNLEVKVSRLSLPNLNRGIARAHAQWLKRLNEVGDDLMQLPGEKTAKEFQLVVGTLKNAANQRAEAATRAIEATRNEEEMTQLLRSDPSESGVDLGRLERQAGKSLAQIHRILASVQERGAQAAGNERLFIQELVRQANRNLVTLLMLVVIYLTVLVVVLPTRILRPVRQLAQIIRRAEPQQIDRWAEESNDEMGELAANFNATMARVRRFDGQKKARIMQDWSKLETLIEHLPHPATVIDRALQMEHANDACRALLGLNGLKKELPLPDLFSQGGAALKQLLVGAFERRQELHDLPVQLLGAQEKMVTKVTVKAIRERGGKARHALVIFRSESEHPSEGS